MAKIKTFSIKYFDNQTAKIDLHFDMDLNSLYFFLNDIPEEVLKYCADKPLTKTLKRRDAVLVENAKEAETQISTIFNSAELNFTQGNKTKVIYYQFLVEGRIGDTVEKDESYGLQNTEANYSYRRLGFSWGTCYALSNKSDSKRVYINENGSPNSELRYFNNNHQIIDWTPEKEIFFKSLDSAFENLSEKMRTFRDTDINEFETLIQSSAGIKLLPEIK